LLASSAANLSSGPTRLAGHSSTGCGVRRHRSISNLLVLLVGFGVPSLGSAQIVDEVSISDDNAQMDFWLPVSRRPDTELTNAAEATATLEYVPRFGLWARTSPCRAVVSWLKPCTTTVLDFGQEMYTPSAATRTAQPIPGQRPYAGWLYAAATVRSSTVKVSNDVRLELGVTGSPSLGEKIQTLWHGLIGYPRALGWSHQMSFVPGIDLSATRSQELLQLTRESVPVLSVTSSATAALGNLFTGARAGAEARFGYGITTPWSSAIKSRGRKLEVYGVAGAREDVIAYLLFLDRSTTRPSLTVAKEPLVFQYEFGLGARYRRFELEYRAISREREYRTGPPLDSHTLIRFAYRPGW